VTAAVRVVRGVVTIVRRAAPATAAALLALALAPGAASACSMCKGTLEDPSAARLAAGYAISIVGMLGVLAAVLVAGGAHLARSVDPEGFQRQVARLRRAGGTRGRAAALSLFAVFAAGAAYATRAAPVEPPAVLPVEALAGRRLIVPDDAVGRLPADLGRSAKVPGSPAPDSADRDSADAGSIAPATTVPVLAPGDLTGRTVVVTFFATWCVPCRGQLDDLAIIQRELGDRVTVVAVNLFERNPDQRAERHVHDDGAVHYHPAPPPAETVGRWLAKEDLRLTVIPASRAIVEAFGGVTRIPSTYVFAPDGRLRRYYFNPPTGDFVRPDLATLRGEVVAVVGKGAGDRDP